MANEEKKKFKDTVVGKLSSQRKKKKLLLLINHLLRPLRQSVKSKGLTVYLLGKVKSTPPSLKRKLALKSLQYQSLAQQNLQSQLLKHHRQRRRLKMMVLL
jgi:hypothetical protein